ncbi:MAG: beta-ketoacyl-ACP synthase II [Eubacteriales bacterium]|nr:beta-ketoacyl-ACP synthase II [Eubacteriales bacterium]
MSNKVMITGMGAVSPIGSNVADSFKSAIDGVCGIDKATYFDAEFTGITAAGEVKDFDPSQYISKREAKRMARFTQLAMVAAMQAWEESGMGNSGFNADRVGVMLGSGMGGLGIICEQYDEMKEGGARCVSSLFIPKAIINTTAGLIAIRLGLHGPCLSVVTACSSGADAIGQAYYAVKEGRLDAVLVGGAESTMIDLAVQGFHQMQALSEQTDPKKASIPFDKDRDGFVMSEGSAFLLLESEAHAKKRGAKPLGQIAGYVQTCDAYHITAPTPDGEYAAKAMALVMKEAGIDKKDVGYINAHGTSTPLNDVSESGAIERCFGDYAKNLLVSSTKSMTGHMLGAAGAFEAVITMCALNLGIAPPTVGLETEAEGCNLDYVKGKAKKMDTQYAISNSFGFGGHNSCILLKKIDD